MLRIVVKQELVRWSVAVIIALVVGIATHLMPHPIRLQGVGIGDIGLPLAGATNFLHGRPPYDAQLRRGRVSSYPFTTMVVLSPLLVFPVALMAPLFCGLSALALAYGILREGPPWRLLIFLSAPFLSAIHSVQWSPLITAAVFLSPLLPIAVAKPQMGIMLLIAGRWTRTAIIIAALLVVLSFLLYPRWPIDWMQRGDLDKYLGRSPLRVGWGFLLAFTLLFWRERIGRVLIGMSIVQQRFFYDQLPLLLVPQTPAQMVAIVLASWIAPVVSITRGWWYLDAGYQDARSWILVLVCTHFLAFFFLLYNHREQFKVQFHELRSRFRE